jgi:signal transduction histidine kinase
VSQPRSADVVPPGAVTAQRTAGPALPPRNRRVALLLIVLVAVLTVLALTGLRVTDETRSGEAYGQVGRLAALDQQVTGLGQAMADERSSAAAFISAGRPAAGLPALRRRYAITDARAARVRRLVSQLGHGYPARTRAGVAQVLVSIAKLPGLRSQTAQGQASAVAVITGYSAATSGLFPVNDGIADPSGNSTLISSGRALGALSRMIDHASQQQAMLGTALAKGRFGPGALTALTTAQARQTSDLASFRDSATPHESWALTETLARPPARQAQAVEQQATAAGNGVLALGSQASQQWSAGMAYTVGWMGHAEQQLAAWIPADAQALQRSETRSAIITGGVALGALALVLLGALFAGRSMARRRRRPEAAALEDAEGPVPSSASAVSDGHEIPHPAEPLALVDVLRVAASGAKEHGRVILDVQPGVWVSGSAATDTAHLLAELLENAATFSPKTTQVIVSGHAVYGGGSLVTITDGGTGMSEEELTLLNWQLASPSRADMAVDRHMGLFTVALLAARHGITVTLSMPPDGGTTAEVYLPDALITLDAEPGGWRERAGEAPWASKEASAGLADLLFPARRFASGPEPQIGPETDTPEAIPVLLGAPVPSPAPTSSGPEPQIGPETDTPQAIPVLLGAPVPSPAPTSTGVTEPGPAGTEPGNGAPIFESVRSGYLHAFGRDPLRFSEQQAGESSAGPPARPPTPWGDGGDCAAAGPSAAGHPNSSWPPRYVSQPHQVGGAAVDQETRQASAAELAEITRSKVASFQRGSHRARTAQMNRSATQPGQDG